MRCVPENVGAVPSDRAFEIGADAAADRPECVPDASIGLCRRHHQARISVSTVYRCPSVHATGPDSSGCIPPPGRPSPRAEAEALDGTVLAMMAVGMGRFTRHNPLDGFEIGFVFLEGPNKGKGYHIRRTPTLIGRTAADLEIPDRRVSRKHAQLDILGPGQFSLKDLASTSGTLVNERPISTTRLENGDIVSFGGTKFKFVVRPMRTTP